jgi:hypothetical protein
MNRNTEQQIDDLVDFGVASVETKGSPVGLPEDIASNQKTGIDEE